MVAEGDVPRDAADAERMEEIRPGSLADMLDVVIEYMNISDDIAEIYAATIGIHYVAGKQIQDDLQRVVKILAENPGIDAMLYSAAFTRGLDVENEIYARSRFANGHD